MFEGTNGVYLKIANRNFNVYRQCFSMHTLCIYPGGEANPSCISNTLLSVNDIEVIPDDNGDTTNEAYLLDEDYSSSSTWTSTPSPTASPTLPTGGDLGKCWAPFTQYIIVKLADLYTDHNIQSISSIRYSLFIYFAILRI